MKTKNKNLYDLIIVGGGPAGLSAAVYATRYKLKTLLLSDVLGGTLIIAPEISNLPGQRPMAGEELAKIFISSLEGKAEIFENKVLIISKSGQNFLVKTKDKNLKSKTVILAIGAERKKLGIPGEKEFEKKGVAYCATCDAPLFSGRKVAVLGGGNSAFYSAILASKYAKKVYLIIRRSIKADPVAVSQAEKIKNIEIIKGISLKKIHGRNFVEGVLLSKKYKGKEILKLDGVFIEIGVEPDLRIIKDLKIKRDRQNFIKVNEEMETNIPGLYAAGDISTGSAGLRQVVTSSAEGAIASASVYNRLKNKN